MKPVLTHSDMTETVIEKVIRDLVDRNLIPAGALARAQAAGGRLDQTLIDLGLVSEDDMADAYSAAFGLPKWEQGDYPQVPLYQPAINPHFLRHAKIVPLGTEEAPSFGVADPFDEQARRAAAFIAGSQIRPVIMTPSAIGAAIGQLYETIEDSDAELPDLLDGDAERLRDLASEGPVVQMVNALILTALNVGATDIHIEPMADKLVLRHRIDGMLQTESLIPRRLAAGLVTRIKVMAGLDIGERRLPQDGRIRQTLQGRDIDFRISTTPTVHGEGVVLRVLDHQTAGGKLHELGLPSAVSTALAAEIQRPHGIVLVTGPTGSGKTTTLYAALRAMDCGSRKILTVEDPVEYMLDGINQVQVKPAIGLTFASALRSFLRQDPDVILVGEIRDGETAKTAIQAALTGHLVLSTLHTNDAAGAVPRLTDMGVDSYLLAATLSGILAQRLVRTLCAKCRSLRAVPEDQASALGLPATVTRIYRATGCPACSGSGYRGRTAIAEWLPVTDDLRALIRRGSAADHIEQAAREAGMISLYQDGLARIAAGLTTPEEVLRVTRAS